MFDSQNNVCDKQVEERVTHSVGPPWSFTHLNSIKDENCAGYPRERPELEAVIQRFMGRGYEYFLWERTLNCVKWSECTRRLLLSRRNMAALWPRDGTHQQFRTSAALFITHRTGWGRRRRGRQGDKFWYFGPGFNFLSSHILLKVPYPSPMHFLNPRLLLLRLPSLPPSSSPAVSHLLSITPFDFNMLYGAIWAIHHSTVRPRTLPCGTFHRAGCSAANASIYSSRQARLNPSLQPWLRPSRLFLELRAAPKRNPKVRVWNWRWI